MKRSILGILVIIFAGCQSTQVKYYDMPLEINIDKTASIVGSKIDPKGWFLADEITHVLAIDSEPVKGGSRKFNTPVRILPGEHVIQIANIQGLLFANISFNISIKGGEHLIAKAEILDAYNVRIWIDDENGEKFTDVLVAPRSIGDGLEDGVIIPFMFF